MKNLKTKTVRELVDLARQWGLTGYSKMKKAELVRKLSKKFGKKPVSKKSGKTATTRKKTGVRDKKRSEPKARRTARKKPVRASTPAPAPKVERQTLPTSYGEGRMMLVARDPYWLYAYWDLTEEQEKKLWSETGATLRVVEVTDSGPREISRIPVTEDARSWYLQVDTANRTYRAELGVTSQRGEFVAIISSNPSFTPRDSVSINQKQAFGSFTPGAAPRPAPAPGGRVSSAELTERMYDMSSGTGIDSAQAQASWGQPSSFDQQEDSGSSEKGE
jgi:hypothetical protein